VFCEKGYVNNMMIIFPFRFYNICRELVIITLNHGILKMILVRPKYFPDLTTQDYVNGFTTAITLYFRLEHEERKSQKTQLPPKYVCRDNGHINF